MVTLWWFEVSNISCWFNKEGDNTRVHETKHLLAVDEPYAGGTTAWKDILAGENLGQRLTSLYLTEEER